MQPNEVFNSLVEQMTEIRREMALYERKVFHAIQAMQVKIGPERWNHAYSIACYLAFRDILQRERRGEFGGSEIEFD